MAIGKVARTRETTAKTTIETAYYLLSTALSAERFNEVVRSHWGVENRLHWRLDVIMNEDQDRNRMDNSHLITSHLAWHMALNVMQKEGTKGSLRGKFKRAAWNDAYPDDILTRYRRYRALSIKHHNEALSRVASETMLDRARQIGLAAGRTLMLDEGGGPAQLIYDLAVYTAPASRTRAVERHAKLSIPKADAEDAQILRGMCIARFSLWRVERHHEITGLVLSDMLRGGEIWLIDEALASVAQPGWVTASQLMPVAEFFMTCGVLVPMDRDILDTVMEDRLGWVRNGDLQRLPDDPRFAIALYRVALQQGAMARVRYRALDEPLPVRGAQAV